MSKIEAHIKDWIEKVSKVRPELGGFSVCPYASKAKYLVVETLAEDIMPISGYDVVFYVVEDYFDLESVQYWVNFYNNLYKEWLFFEDCASYNTYIGDVQTNNSKYNLILMQDKEHLRKHREKLAKTGYYHHWNDAYLKEILGDDYKILKK
jgi:hypothetical protein